jgi:NAD(P)-dependent dehydrogenase (short-subunit alcohol dehydrogenase family)
MMDLIGKVAVVTGAGQGIGKGIAKRLLEEGMSVVIADIDAEAGNEAAGELEALGSVRAERFGHLDALINNAGLADPETGPLEALSLADWNRRIASNLTGVFLCSKHAIPALRRSSGAIVNIASSRALQSEPHTEAYAASKGGVVALTHAMAVSLGPEIRVNCISPGWIVVDDWKKASRRAEPALRWEDHAQHPVGRAGRPDDVAELVCYLISPRSGFLSGQNIVLDGGMTRKMIYI